MTASAIAGVVGIVTWGVLFLLANTVKEGVKNGAKSLFGHHFVFMTFWGQIGKGFAAGLGIGRQDWLLYGLIGGLVVWLLVGGQAVIWHVLVRVLLWWEGKLPWNVARFLNYGRDVVLLRKVGGGYMFVHRLLLEYFVSIEQRLGRRKEITMPR